jgi:integron integrase
MPMRGRSSNATVVSFPDTESLLDTGSPPKLLDRVRRTIRMRHYSRRTENTYVHWIRRFIVFHHKQHPNTMGAPEITAFLSWLAVLHLDLGPIEPAARGKLPQRVPVVLTPAEVSCILGQLTGVMWLAVAFLYGAGLRLQECLELRVKDLDFERHEILVRRGKGQKDRRSMLPAGIDERLRAHLQEVKRQHEQDLAAGFGRVVLPFALDRKYPKAAATWGWQFVFPAARICRDARWGPPSRFHLHESVVQKAVATAARKAGLAKQVGCHTFRHSFATELLRSGHDIRTVRELLGHADVATTMVYTHVLNRGGLGVRSPFDKL